MLELGFKSRSDLVIVCSTPHRVDVMKHSCKCCSAKEERHFFLRRTLMEEERIDVEEKEANEGTDMYG